MAARHVNRLPCVKVAGVVFIHPCRPFADAAPALGDDVFHVAVYHYKFSVGIGRTVVCFRAPVVAHVSVGAGERAFHEHVPVVPGCVPHPRERSSAVAQVAPIGKQAASPQYGVAISVNLAGFHIDGAVGLQGISRPDDMHTVEGDAFAVQQQSFGLSFQGCGDGDVFQGDVVAVVEHEGCTA